MKTVKKINGLDVEFTDTPPTRPGVYYVNNSMLGDNYDVNEVFDFQGQLCILMLQRPKPVTELPSHFLFSAPLVPVMEVERAYDSGYRAGLEHHHSHYQNSNARRVVEGLE